MPYVIIRHKVANYAKWKRAVHAFKRFRRTSGETSFHVLRCAKNPNDLTVCCSWDTTARMKKFMKSAELRNAMKGAGVVGKPQIAFFDRMDVLTAE